MPRPSVAVLAASILLAPLAQGQESVGRGRRLTLAAGPLLISQRDENASPLRYGGAGPSVQIGYGTKTDRRSLAVRLGGAIGALRSSVTDASELPRQETYRGWLEVEYARSPSAADSHTRWFLGGLLAVHGTGIHHFYALGESQAGYAFFSAALGPVVAVERATRDRMTVSAQLGIGLFALIARPSGVYYRSGHLIPVAFRLHVAAVDAFQTADLRAAYTVSLTRRVDIALGYGLVLERYRDAQPFRFASQGVSLVLVSALGGDQ
jgi:hypothetical protein